MEEPRKSWRRSAVFLTLLWIVLLALSLSVLSSVVTPFLRSLQTQGIVSLDWAGYAVASDSLVQQPVVVGLNGSWTVPAVNISADDRYSAAWIGIGGQFDETLIQVGTEHDSIDGQARYTVWYEMLPANSVPIPEVTISPGDNITASISLVDSDANEWLIKIDNLSNGQGFGQNFRYNSTRLSAEWIVERPLVNDQVTTLTDFGSITFTEAAAQVGDKVGSISGFPNYEIVMSNRQNVQLVTVSQLSSDGSSFIVSTVG